MSPAGPLTAHGLNAADFDNVPYMVLKGDYTGTNASCVDTVNAIKARRTAGQGKAAVELYAPRRGAQRGDGVAGTA